MIIDDSADHVELMEVVFQMVDRNVIIVTADDGDAALKIMRDDPSRLPKVILLDLRMPRKSGLEILSEIKADPLLKRIPVCIFSAGDTPKDIRESYERGANMYLKKPRGLDDLKLFAQNFCKLWYDFSCHNS
jgi:chemotaxis family two-component system response regulator Rcp1